MGEEIQSTNLPDIYREQLKKVLSSFRRTFSDVQGLHNMGVLVKERTKKENKYTKITLAEIDKRLCELK